MNWKCPDCGATSNKHGKGECASCIAHSGICSGFICDCDMDTGAAHGTAKEPCPAAHCYHCHWQGEFPTGMVKCPTCKGAGKVKKPPKVGNG